MKKLINNIKNTIQKIFTFKRMSHFLLFVVSVTFTLFLFLNFGVTIEEKFFWGMMGVALELTKEYMLQEIKTHHRNGQKKIRNFKIFVHTGIVLVSCLATFGFSLYTINKQDFTAAQKDNTRIAIVKEIEVNEAEMALNLKQIEADQLRQSKLDPTWITRANEISALINKTKADNESLKARNAELNKQLSELPEVEVAASNIFDLMAQILPIKDLQGKNILFWIMMAMVIWLELSLIATSGDTISVQKKEEMRALFNYINELFPEKNGDRLVSDKKIAAKTGMDLRTCKKYKKILKGMTYNGLPIINTTRGGSKPNFTKNEVMKIAADHFSMVGNS